VGANTLTRFFILHIGLLPTVMFALLGLHVLLIRLQGVTELQFEGEEVQEESRYFRFWPDHVTTELLIGVLLMYLLTILALVFPAGLGAPADPTQTPAHIKPEWYFYFNFRLLKLTSLRVSVVSTMIGGLIIAFWPFIEGWLQRRYRFPDGASVLLGALAFLGFLVLTVWESLAV
jgi:ubiquinol-cytochrome c reductase cytochrome b subunit/cytochrome b6